MSALTTPTSPVLLGPLFHLSVAQYHEMIAAGILTSDDPVELLDGVLVQKMPKNPPHATAVRRAVRALERTVPTGWCALPEAPITLATSVPEPDVAFARGSMDDYTARHPNPTEIALLIEVADWTLTRDQTTKLALYAAANIPQYWIVNLPARCLHLHTDPDSVTATYRNVQTLSPGQVVPLAVPGYPNLEIAVSDLLPLP